MIDWWLRWRERRLDRMLERVMREIMSQNAHLSREDGYRYPRCDIEDKPNDRP